MNTKEITSAALMVALSIILALIMYMIPILQGFVFLVGLPIVVLGVKFNLKVQFLASLALGMLMSILDPFYGLSIVLMVTPMSILQGFLIKKQKKNSQVILLGTLASIFGFISMLYLVQVFFQMDLINELTTMFDTSIGDLRGFYESTNLIAKDDLEEVFSMMAQMKEVMLILIPSAIGIYGFLMSVGSFVLSRVILNRMKLQVSNTLFKDFRIDKNARNTLMIVLLVIIAASYIDESNMTYYILNTMSIFMVMMQINGLAYVWYLTEKHPNRRMMRIMIVILFLVSPIFGGIIEIIVRYGLGAIGFLDMYVNFRQRQKKE